MVLVRVNENMAWPVSRLECITVPIPGHTGLGTPTFTIYDDMPPPRIEILDEVLDWLGERRNMCRIEWSRPKDSEHIYAAYIRFDDPNLAFEFKMRWG